MIKWANLTMIETLNHSFVIVGPLHFQFHDIQLNYILKTKLKTKREQFTNISNLFVHNIQKI